MRITKEMIPYGFNNRITKETLMRTTNQCERCVRDQLSELAAEIPLCMSSQWTGVFRPLPNERTYVKVTHDELLKRSMSTLKRLGSLNDFLQEDIQPSLFGALDG